MTIDAVSPGLADTLFTAMSGQGTHPASCGLEFLEILAADLAPLLTAVAPPQSSAQMALESKACDLPVGINVVEVTRLELGAINVVTPQTGLTSPESTAPNDSDVVETDETAEDAPLPIFFDVQSQIPTAAPASSALPVETRANTVAPEEVPQNTAVATDARHRTLPAVEVRALPRTNAKPVAFTIEIEEKAPAAPQSELKSTAGKPLQGAQAPHAEPDSPSVPPVQTAGDDRGRALEKIRAEPLATDRAEGPTDYRRQEIRPVIKTVAAERKLDRTPHSPQFTPPSSQQHEETPGHPRTPMAISLEPAAASVRLPQPAAPIEFRPIEAPVAVKPQVERASGTREFVLQLPSAVGKNVQVHLTEAAGHVRVTVRCSDPQITTALRNDLGDLVRSLTSKGYQIEAWTPPETHPFAESFTASAAAGADSLAGDQPRDSNTLNHGAEWHDERQQNRSRQRWLSEFERRLEEE